jgi:cyclohexyl-isocyanide hydratase
MADDTVLAFLRAKAAACRFVTSVCTGSLVLAAAGLLRGYRATCHWTSIDQLALLGVSPVPERIVRDRDRITGAGVTSGIDFALFTVAEIFGAPVAEYIQLSLEYDPEPPFASGSPRQATAELVADALEKAGTLLERRLVATKRAAEKLGRPAE